MDTSTAREKILKRLRQWRAPFEDVEPPPAHYLPVTRLAADEDLVIRFGAELDRLGGKLHLPLSDEEAITAVLGILQTEGADTIMHWENLPLPGLLDALKDAGIGTMVPRPKGETHFEVLAEAHPVRVGITGADAGFATTGTMALVTREGQGRLPSLLPPVHIALLRRDRLYPRPEDWLTGEGRRAMQNSRSIAFVTGPSRTGDIEMKIIVGVHGPRLVHVVLI